MSAVSLPGARARPVGQEGNRNQLSTTQTQESYDHLLQTTSADEGTQNICIVTPADPTECAYIDAVLPPGRPEARTTTRTQKRLIVHRRQAAA